MPNAPRRQLTAPPSSRRKRGERPARNPILEDDDYSAAPLTMDALQQRMGRAGAPRGGSGGGGMTNIALNFAGSQNLKIKEELSRSDYEVVNAAADLTLRRPLVVRTLVATDDDAKARFIEEAQITGQLQHPNIQPVYELGVSPDGQPWMIMARMIGRPLHDLVGEMHGDDDDSELAIARRERNLIETFLKVCDAVSYAHTRGIIHRDLKPEVIVVGDHGDVVVSGWREAKPVHTAAHEASDTDQVMSDRRALGGPLTMEGTLIGTLPWMPPEQAAGRVSQLDETADVYNLGAILYYMLTDSPPYVAERDDEVLADIMEGLLVPPSERAPHSLILPELEQIVTKAMASRPALRYQSVFELRDALEDYLAGRALASARAGVTELLKRWAMDNVMVVIAVVAVLLALIILPPVIVGASAGGGDDKAKIERLEKRIQELESETGG